MGAKDGIHMTGILTDIQKFSLNDGDGIRTTVFLKGCNMRCTWCHNPETIGRQPQPAYYPEKCIGCGHCEHCPTGARVMLGREYTPQSVWEEIASDTAYYAASGGGVTLSGGEPLLQEDFCMQLLTLCRQSGIGTAIETNLSLPFETLLPLLPLLDTVFFDIKLMDDALHRKHTGVSNSAVLRNARQLAQRGIPAVVRTPLVPGITATVENIGAIAAFLAELSNIRGYELLNYNPLGAPKYTALGQPYELAALRPLPPQEIAVLVQAASRHGFPVTCR